MNETSPQTVRLAAISALSAYLAWGILGLYYKALDHVSALEILSHRIVWSLAVLSLIITYTKNWQAVARILRAPKTYGIFTLSTVLISVNWGGYIYAVVSGQALEASMGYYIMPLVVVGLGALFFGERFSRTQAIAIGLAAIGVVYQVLSYGQIPWIALMLAFSFSFYGMLRKKAPADSVVGLFIETLLISPVAITAMVYWASQNELYALQAPTQMVLFLALAGPFTAIPLILFAYGARNLRYSTVGILQYINPTCQFLLAVFIFKEEFELTNLFTFAFIWCGLLLYSQDSLRQSRRKKSGNS